MNRRFTQFLAAIAVVLGGILAASPATAQANHDRVDAETPAVQPDPTVSLLGVGSDYGLFACFRRNGMRGSCEDRGRTRQLLAGASYRSGSHCRLSFMPGSRD